MKTQTDNTTNTQHETQADKSENANLQMGNETFDSDTDQERKNADSVSPGDSQSTAVDSVIDSFTRYPLLFAAAAFAVGALLAGGRSR